jgi:3-deoxy-D-manno-octulosonic acid kinase
LGRSTLLLRRELATHAPAIAVKLVQLRGADEPGFGNRGSGFRVRIAGIPDLFARHSRRGGFFGQLLGDLYFGLKPRQFRELTVASQAAQRGVPIAQPTGAMVEWVAPGFYRGFFLSQALDGMSLWEFVRTDDDAMVRLHVLEQARAAIETMHRAGLFHADLNLHNLFVTHRGDGFAVMVLDLDKARLINRPLPETMRRGNRNRLLRSIRKLDPDRRYFNDQAIEILTGG